MNTDAMLCAAGQLLQFAGGVLTVIRAHGWTAQRPASPEQVGAAVDAIVELADVTHNLSSLGCQVVQMVSGDPVHDPDLMLLTCRHLKNRMRTAEENSEGAELLPGSSLRWAEGIQPLMTIMTELQLNGFQRA